MLRLFWPSSDTPFPVRIYCHHIPKWPTRLGQKNGSTENQKRNSDRYGCPSLSGDKTRIHASQNEPILPSIDSARLFVRCDSTHVTISLDEQKSIADERRKGRTVFLHGECLRTKPNAPEIHHACYPQMYRPSAKLRKPYGSRSEDSAKPEPNDPDCSLSDTREVAQMQSVRVYKLRRS